MATKVLSNDFMQRIATDEAWKELSKDFHWSESLLEKYQDNVDWAEISTNWNIGWTIPMIQKFKNRINWDSFSAYAREETLTENILSTFKDKWNWHKLSTNTRVKLSYELLDKFADLWDWEEIIGHADDYSFDEDWKIFDGRGIDFYERYKDRIPAAKVQSSNLWREIVSQQKKQLIEDITA